LKPDADAYAPGEIARRVETAARAKAALTVYQTFMLAVLGGAFIGIGVLFYLQVISAPLPLTGATRLLGGIVFSLGLVMIVVGGAELFTGNMLVVMALADGQVSLAAVARNWGLVYLGNLVGAVLLMCLGAAGGLFDADSALASSVSRVVAAKGGLTGFEAFSRGVLCNVLVCMAIWLAMSCHSTLEKIVSVVFPVAAFVAIGLEHSIANMAFFPAQMLATGSTDIGWVVSNLLPVTLGNMVGGGVLVALVYRSIYRPAKQ